MSGIALERNDLQDEGAELLVHVAREELLEALAGSGNRLHLAGRPEASWIRVGDRTLSAAAWLAELGDTSASLEPVPYPDPGRTLAGYAATLGVEGGRAGFLAAARRQSRLDWRPELTASAANAWIRAGFGR